MRSSLEPEKLETFIDLVEHDEGYPLYQAVSATKMALSADDEAEFNFPPLGKAGRKTVRRADFESWIADDLGRIEGALDDVLATTNTSPNPSIRYSSPAAPLSCRRCAASSPNASAKSGSKPAASCCRSPMVLP